MRRSQITPEKIGLSKRAKTLGFPQVVEEGDFICYTNTYGNREISLVTRVVAPKKFWLGDGSYIVDGDEWFLILDVDEAIAKTVVKNLKEKQ